MREVRYTASSDFDLRGTSGEGATLAGYAAVFNSPTEIAGAFREQVAPKAFNKTLNDGDVRVLFNHDSNVVLGRFRGAENDTAQLSADSHGLRYVVTLPSTQAARDLYTSIERGDISGSSFAFEVEKNGQTMDAAEEEGDLPLRTLRNVRLYDVSPVTYPAYEDTEVSAREARSVLEAAGFDIRVAPNSAATTPEPVVEPPQALAATPVEPEPDVPHGRPLYVARRILTEMAGITHVV